MKIKFTCTGYQFGELVNIVGLLPYDKKINDLHLDNNAKIYFHKKKKFSIDVNHYEALKSALSECGNIVSQYNKSLFEHIKQIAEPQILRAVSGYKLLG